MTQLAQVDHIHSFAKKCVGLDETSEKRIASIYRLAYIPYPKAEAILALIEQLYSQDTPVRPRGLLLSAPSGNGKTTILNAFVHWHPIHHSPDVEIVPVLLVEAPPVPNENRFLGQILRGFDNLLEIDNANLHQIPSRGNILESGSAEIRLARVSKLVKYCRVRLMFVDEIHNLLAGTARQVEECCNLLKFLSNQLSIRIVLVGTERAENVLRSDSQLVSRFPIIKLPLWKDGKPYRRFLSTLESELGLKQQSNLDADEKASFLLEHSQGVLGEIVMAVKDAAVMAIRDGNERIAMNHLRHSFFRLQQRPTIADAREVSFEPRSF